MSIAKGSATYKGNNPAEKAHSEARGTVVSAGHFYLMGQEPVAGVQVIGRILR